MALTAHRVIPLDGCFNFRDLGGYPTADGRTVRWRTVFRADGLHRLSPDGTASLRALGLRTIIDLRTPAELAARGRVEESDGVAYHHLPMIDVLPPAEDLGRWLEPRYVADQYGQMLTAGSASVTAALELLADPAAHPVAYHCMAGKDRTGILTAVLLGLLGVADEDIAGDYALSRPGMERMLAWLRETYADQPERITVNAAALVAAEPESMALFLAGLRSEHGSVQGYVESLGLAGVGEALCAALLEEPAPGEPAPHRHQA